MGRVSLPSTESFTWGSENAGAADDWVVWNLSWGAARS